MGIYYQDSSVATTAPNSGYVGDLWIVY